MNALLSLHWRANAFTTWKTNAIAIGIENNLWQIDDNTKRIKSSNNNNNFSTSLVTIFQQFKLHIISTITFLSHSQFLFLFLIISLILLFNMKSSNKSYKNIALQTAANYHLLVSLLLFQGWKLGCIQNITKQNKKKTRVNFHEIWSKKTTKFLCKIAKQPRYTWHNICFCYYMFAGDSFGPDLWCVVSLC